MNRNFPKIITAVALLSTPASKATTITFDDLTADDTHTLGNSAVIPPLYNGLTFGYPWLGFDNANSSLPAHSGSWVVGNQYGGNAEIGVPSGTFVFDGLWIRAFYNNLGSGLVINGYNGSTLQYSIPVTLPVGFGLSSAQDPWLQIAGNSAQVTRLQFDVGTQDTIFEVDDLKVEGLTSSSVPDAGETSLLLGVGCLSLRALRPRKA